MKKKFIYSLGLLMSLLTFSSFTDDPGNSNNQINGHEYVDLGLSVKWATCNVGAYAPEEYGSYYAWGETTEKSDYSWDTYKWCDGDEYSLFKYCTDSYYGRIDNKTVLASEDDVAHVKWGGSWRMPTVDELHELVYGCTWQWTNRRGVYGYRVFGPNGNSIFLPASGAREYTSLSLCGEFGYYWTSSLDCSNCHSAYFLVFNQPDGVWYCAGNAGGRRSIGWASRPVCD